jgi:2'-5' RNA ligase
MQGLVILLDDASSAAVQEIWQGVEDTFDVRLMPAGTVPHISLHVAEHYDEPLLRERAASLARSMTPFSAHTSGFAVFTGSEPVVYLPVARNPRLTLLHRAAWQEAGAAAAEPSAFYAVDRWLPHVTIAQPGMTTDMLTALAVWLNRRPLDLEIAVNEIAILENMGEGDGILARYRLEG